MSLGPLMLMSQYPVPTDWHSVVRVSGAGALAGTYPSCAESTEHSAEHAPRRTVHPAVNGQSAAS